MVNWSISDDTRVMPDLPTVEAEPSRRDALLALLVAVGGVAVGAVLARVFVDVALQRLAPGSSVGTEAAYTYPPSWYVSAGMAGEVVGFGLAIVLAMWWFQIPRDIWRFRIRDVYFIGLGVPLTMIALLIDLATISQQQSPQSAYGTMPNVTAPAQSAPTSSSLSTSLMVLLVLVLVPIAQQILFQGVVFSSLRWALGPYTRASVTCAAVIVAVVWCLLSFGIAVSYWPAIVLISLTQSYVFVRRRRIWPCVFTAVGFGAVFLLLWIMAVSGF